MDESKTGLGALAKELPMYKSHKVVRALKIKGINAEPAEPSSEMYITPEENGYTPFIVSDAYVSKHKPQVGGYYVKYEDGYESFSPADAFEDGYTKV